METLNFVQFMEVVGKLKHIKRTGWVLRDINEPETVAGHMYRMAVLCFMIGPGDSLDKNKCLKMCLIHDLAEAIVGDITPYCGVSEEEKHKREAAAMDKITSLIGIQGQEIRELFEEYEERKTPEAKFVKELDKLDLIAQAYDYEQRDDTPGKLQEFFEGHKLQFENVALKAMADQIICSRNIWIAGKRPNTLFK